ncbi:MAG: cell wall hydrolase [Novosphingobium aromaticivorans]|nr:cell wall hydrolase [Novosphingobium aromaticivorans]
MTQPFPLLPPEALVPPLAPCARADQAALRQEAGERLAMLVLPEVPPRDFTGRIRRRDMVSWRHQHRRAGVIRARAGGIAAIGALGLVLGALGWGEPGIDRAAAAQDSDGRLRAMPAPDQPAMQPTPTRDGTQADPRSAQNSPEASGNWASRLWNEHFAAIHSDAAPSPFAAGPFAAGPSATGFPAAPGVARPLFAAGDAQDRWRALQCLTAAIYYEAASEPENGQRAVAQVVLNRVAHPAFPKTVCGVVYQGSERPGCQFSFACDGAMARRPMPVVWDRVRRIAAQALDGQVYAPVGLATHYHTSAVHPGWADSLAFIGTIGAHRFYRWSGAAGLQAAFRGIYHGGEPLAAPHPRSWTSVAADIADPLTLEQAFEQGRMAALDKSLPAQPALAPSHAPLHTGTAHEGMSGRSPAASAPLPQAGPAAPALRPEASAIYENAGKWIAQPGS